MSAQSGLQRAIQGMNTDEGQNSNRGQKDVIIRKNSSKLLRPASGQKLKEDTKKDLNPQSSAASGQHYRNKSQVVKKNIIANKVIAQGIELTNPAYTGVNSPQDKNPVLMMYNQTQGNVKNPKSLIMTDSTHANS
jgi:hypothetical protein